MASMAMYLSFNQWTASGLVMWKRLCFSNYLCPSCHWEINVVARIVAILLDQVDKDYIKFDFIQIILESLYESWTYLLPTYVREK